MTIDCDLLTVHSCFKCRSVGMSGHMCFLHQNPAECTNTMHKFSSCIIFLNPFPSALACTGITTGATALYCETLFSNHDFC